jgi:hypothetical protein
MILVDKCVGKVMIVSILSANSQKLINIHEIIQQNAIAEYTE